MNSLLEELTPEQHEAVTHGDGPCLVIAGAGTGKTKVITHRIAYLITEKSVPPESILALTFTDKAAAEMQERVDLLVPYGMFGSTIATFHSFCNELVRRHGFVIGTDPGADQVGPAESVSLLRANLDRLPIKEHRLPGNPAPFLRQLVSYVDRATEEGVSPEDIERYASAKLKEAEDEADEEAARKQLELAACYRVAKEIYREQNVLTYADLISQALQILRTSALALKEERARYPYILVDEFQDTNTSQAEVVYLLAGTTANVMAVGDDDQAIYRFRGANIQNILTFREHYPKAKIVTLRDNFRSGQPILDAAYRLIQHNNPNRLEIKEGIDKRLIAHQPFTEPVDFQLYLHSAFENEAIASTIEDLNTTYGYAYSDMAVLVRAHHQGLGIEEALARRGIPVVKHRDTGFYDLPVIQRAVAYLRFLLNPGNDTNLFFLLASPPFNVSLAALRTASSDARYLNNSLWEQLETMDGDALGTEGEAALAFLRERLSRPLTPPSEALFAYIKESGSERQLLAAEAHTELNQLNTLMSEIRSFENLHRPATVERYVTHLDDLIATEEEVRTVNDLENEPEGVHVMTVHKSKGLEFRAVFVPQLAMQRFPSTRGESGLAVPAELLHVPEDSVKYEEERRLAYVAFTRARERLFLSRAVRYDDNKTDKKPSPFIIEALDLASEPEPTVIDLSAAHVPSMLESELPLSRPEMPRKISASALEAFETCPKRFEFEYVYRINKPSSPEANFGTSIHRALQTALTLRKAGEPIKMDDIYAKAWVPGGYSTKEIEKKWYADGLQAVSRYIAGLPGDFAPDRLEVPLELTLSSGIKITGRADRIDRDLDGTLHIVDYKTGRGEVKKSSVKQNLPLALYAAALIASGEKVGSVSLHYLMKDMVLSLPVSALDLDATIKKAEELVGEIEKAFKEGRFDTKPSAQSCAYCSFNSICSSPH